MKNLTSVIQSYIGMTPKDHQCSNWTEMMSKMEEEINEVFEHEITLYKEIHFIESAVNNFWCDAQMNLSRKDLGDIERQIYNDQKDTANRILNTIY